MLTDAAKLEKQMDLVAAGGVDPEIHGKTE
jgi:hypothetical protein